MTAPDATTTGSLNVNTMSVSTATPVALSTGTVETSCGGVVSMVVKPRLVVSVIPEYALPSASWNALGSMLM